IDGGSEGTAGCTPRRPEIHKYGCARLHNFRFEVVIRDLDSICAHSSSGKFYSSWWEAQKSMTDLSDDINLRDLFFFQAAIRCVERRRREFLTLARRLASLLLLPVVMIVALNDCVETVYRKNVHIRSSKCHIGIK